MHRGSAAVDWLRVFLCLSVSPETTWLRLNQEMNIADLNATTKQSCGWGCGTPPEMNLRTNYALESGKTCFTRSANTQTESVSQWVKWVSERGAEGAERWSPGRNCGYSKAPREPCMHRLLRTQSENVINCYSRWTDTVSVSGWAKYSPLVYANWKGKCRHSGTRLSW